MKLTLTAAASCALTMSLLTSAASGAGVPIIDYLEIQTLTRHQRVSIHGSNLDQVGQVHIAGIPAFVVPIPGTNAVKMNAYVPANAPYGFCDVTVTTSAGTSNPLSLNVVPRRPDGHKLWRFFMNNQLMIHRPVIGADGTVFAKSQAGDLIAITPQGEMKWFLQLGSDIVPQTDIGPNGTIYTAVNDTIYAVDPNTGTILWTYSDPFPNQGIVAGPNVGPDGNIYAVSHVPGLGIFSLDPQGQLRWSGPDQLLYNPWGQLGCEITFSSNQLFFCVDSVFDSFDFAGNHKFRQFIVTQLPGNCPQTAVGPNGDSYVEEWGQLRSHAPNGNLNWMAFGVGGSYLRDPDVGPDGTIYVMRNVFNTFYAVNPNGSTKWTYNHPETLLNPEMDPTGNTIVVGGAGSGTAFYMALSKDGAPLWQADMPTEALTPFQTVLAFPQGNPRFNQDGSVAYVMASSTSNSGGHSYLYALQVGPHVDVGHALTGTYGNPRLAATGTLVGGTAFTLAMDTLAPGATVFLVAGTQALGAPFNGGVLLPSPDLILPVTADAAGKVTLPFNWPTGLPSDLPIYVQAWTPDAGGLAGFAATNALSLITP